MRCTSSINVTPLGTITYKRFELPKAALPMVFIALQCVLICAKMINTMMISSYVVMEMDDRLDDAKAVAPMLVTVDVRHTFRIVLSSSTNKQLKIKMEFLLCIIMTDRSAYFDMRKLPRKSRFYLKKK